MGVTLVATGLLLAALDLGLRTAAWTIVASATLVALGALLVGIAQLARRRARFRSREAIGRTNSLVPDCERLPVAVLSIDPRGAIAWANVRVHVLLGRAPGTLVGIPVASLGWEGPWPPSISGAAGSEDRLAATRYQHPDGRERELEWTLRPTSESADVSWTVTIEDVSERNTRYREADSLRFRLQQTQRLETMGTIASGIAHDFNNLLAPIMGFAEMLQLDLDPSSEAYEDLSHVRTAAGRAKELVAQMMDFSRPEAGAALPIHLQSIVREVTQLLRASLPETIDISGEVDRSLPAVLGSVTQIHQILFNLCTNAADAMPDGGTIRMSVDRFDPLATTEPTAIPEGTGPLVRLRVEDDGHGMDAETTARIFEPFYTTKEAGKGTGLGLATVQRIVTDFGGTISVASTPGKGTTFTLLFPSIESDEDRSDALVEAAAVPGHGTILVVDDEAGVRRVTERILRRLGYEVRAFDDGLEALAAIDETPFAYDLVLTNDTMPGLTGRKLARELKQRSSHVPVILTSGYVEFVSDADLLEAGVTEFLPKPASASQVGQAVARVLMNRSGRGDV